MRHNWTDAYPISLPGAILRVVALAFALVIVDAWAPLSPLDHGVALADDDDGSDDGDDDDGGYDGDDDDSGYDGDDDDSGDDDDGGSSGGGGRAGNGGDGASTGNFFQRRFLRRNRPGRVERPRVRQRQAAPRRAQRRPAPPPPERAPDEIVVLGISDDAIETLVERGYRVLERDTVGQPPNTLVKFRIPRGTSLEAARDEAADLDPEAATGLNHYYRAGSDNVPSPLDACDGYHCAAPRLINWPVLPGSGGSCGAGARIGLIDTGINPDHETFKGGKLELLGDVVEDLPESSRQHGTAVAAILIGSAESRSPGLLPDATVIAVDAFHRAGGRDERSDVFALVRALEMLAARDVSIINLSLAGPPNPLVEAIVTRLNAAGVVLVAAAGNGGPRAKPAYPGAYPGVIAVTALDRSKRVYRRAGRGPHIDFAAPGVDVWTAASIRGARTKTGTSFAVPFVTAAAALAQAGHGEADPDAVLAALVDTALDLGDPGRDDIFGHGLVQAAGLCGVQEREG